MKLSKIITMILFLCFIYLACGDSAVSQKNSQPETVYSVKYIWKSDEWYQKQINLWKAKLDRDPKNPEAWYNYYKANRYYQFDKLRNKEKQQKLMAILQEMGTEIPESFAYNYLMGVHTPNKDLDKRMDFLFKAYKIDPSRPEVLYTMVDYYDMQGDLSKRREFYRELYESRDLATGLLEYNYNVLMSVEQNGILITHGDNDTYPVLLLQDVFDVRPDVTVLNISMLKHLDGYLESRMKRRDIQLDYRQLPDRRDDTFLLDLSRYLYEGGPGIPVYFALTVYKNYLDLLDGKLHITGLAYKFDSGECDNLALIKRNIEGYFRLDYLSFDWYAESFIATGSTQTRLNMNYVIPLLMLAEHYQRSDDMKKAKRLKNLALKIGETAGQTESVEAYLEEKKL
jgi:tetratricopeptide (TPR) repeat protein